MGKPYFFHTVMRFETGARYLEWLNKTITVATAERKSTTGLARRVSAAVSPGRRISRTSGALSRTSTAASAARRGAAAGFASPALGRVHNSPTRSRQSLGQALAQGREALV